MNKKEYKKKCVQSSGVGNNEVSLYKNQTQFSILRKLSISIMFVFI